MTDRCRTCDRADCPWIKFEPMDWEEFDKYESEETSAARDDCQFHAIDWRARALKAEADLVACEKERDAMRPIYEHAVSIVDEWTRPELESAWMRWLYDEATKIKRPK